MRTQHRLATARRVPTWYQPSFIIDEEVILAMLRRGAHEMLYFSVMGDWRLTNAARNIAVSEQVVTNLRMAGKILPRFTDSDKAFGTGPTIDVAATRAAHKPGQNLLIYVGEAA